MTSGTRKWVSRVLFAVVATIGLTMIALPVQAQIKWAVAPYVWTPNISIRADVNGVDVVDRTRTFSNIVDDTDFAFMGYVEARGERWGVFLDTTFLNLGDQLATVHVQPVGGTTLTDVHMDAKATLLDGVVFYRPGGGDDGLDYLFGVRALDIDMKLDFNFTTDTTRVQVDENLFNVIAGLRYTKRIGDKWDFGGRVDIGTGDARLTWNGQALAGYRFSDRMSLHFGWKYTELKFESDPEVPAQVASDVNVDSKIEISGPLVGMIFRF